MAHILQITNDLPALIGINHTHILCQINYLINRGEDTRMTIDEDGVQWLSKTYKEWNHTFNWLSLSGLRKCFRQLKQWGYLHIIQGRDRNQFALTDLAKSLLNAQPSEPETPEKETPPNDARNEPEPALSNIQDDTEYQSGCHTVTPISYINKENNKRKDITTGGNNSTSNTSNSVPTPPPDILIPFRDKLCDICQKDKRLPRIKRKANPVASEMIFAGYELSDLDCVADYVKNDWHYPDIEFVQVQDIVYKAVRKYGRGQADQSGLFKGKTAAPRNNTQYEDKGDYSAVSAYREQIKAGAV